MINESCFLLGAGANVPEGFDTGGGLLKGLRGIDPQTLMGNAGQQITKAEAAAFRSAVLDNMLPSIDAMLEHRTDLVRVGKRVMATLLYKDESGAGPKSFDEDWMAICFLSVWQATHRRYKCLRKTRSLSSHLITTDTRNIGLCSALVARYNVNEREAWDANQADVHPPLRIAGKPAREAPAGATMEPSCRSAPPRPTSFTP